MDNNSNTTRAKLAKLIDDGSCAEAADLTASTILAEFVVIPRADLPEVVEEGEYLHVDGWSYDKGHVDVEKRRRGAMRDLALAEYLDAKEAREAEQAAEARITARRDELVAELGREVYGVEIVRPYPKLTPVAQAAIGWLIEAQDKLAEAQEAQA